MRGLVAEAVDGRDRRLVWVERFRDWLCRNATREQRRDSEQQSNSGVHLSFSLFGFDGFDLWQREDDERFSMVRYRHFKWTKSNSNRLLCRSSSSISTKASSD